MTTIKLEPAGAILEQVEIFKDSVKKALPGYEVKWASTGIYTSEFSTLEDVCIRFTCTKIDKSDLTEEQLKVLEELHARKS